MYTRRLLLAAVAVALVLFAPDAAETPRQRFLAVVDDPTAFSYELLDTDSATVRLVVEQVADVVIGEAYPRQVSSFADRDDVDAVEVLDSVAFDSSYQHNEPIADDRPAVYVMDTPVDANAPWFADVGDDDVLMHGGYSRYVDRDDRDCAEHGTSVAGVLVGKSGLVRNVTVVPVSVVCSTSDVEALLGGLEWIVKHHPEGTPGVLNASFSPQHHELVVEAVRTLTAEHNLVQVWSAGNDGVDACDGGLREHIVDDALIVGGISNARRISHNYGPCVDVFTDAVDVHTASLDKPEGTTKSGTSLAAPRVAAAAVRMLQLEPHLDAYAVYDHVVDTVARPGVTRADDSSPDRFVAMATADDHYELHELFTQQDESRELTLPQDQREEVRPVAANQPL